MKYVIDISEDDYRKVQDGRASVSMMRKAIINGTPLPKGYGRLIDADALKKKAVMCPTVGNAETLLLDISDVENAPTIIEADREGSEEDGKDD